MTRPDTSRPTHDFPFYDGRPVALSPLQWAALMVSLVIAFIALALPMDGPGGAWTEFVPAVLFCGIPLLALRQLAGRHWQSLFRRIGWRELGWTVGIAVLNLLVTTGVALVVQKLVGASANPAGDLLVAMDDGNRLLFFARMVPQLLGEELITILPFLAVMAGLTRGLGASRRSAWVSAWLISSLMFGLLHLPTYDWNWIQCIAVIGSARLVLSLAWIVSKNLWVSTGAHVLNDWALFGLGLAANGLATSPG